MSKERFDPDTEKWVSHEEILKNLEVKKQEKGILPPSEEADLEHLRRAKAAEDQQGQKRPKPSIFK